MRKRILATIVFLVLMAIMTLTASAMTFSDVTATDWFADAVYTSVDLGLINGKERTLYKVEKYLRRCVDSTSVWTAQWMWNS